MLGIFKKFQPKTTIFDDFPFYEAMEMKKYMKRPPHKKQSPFYSPVYF